MKRLHRLQTLAAAFLFVQVAVGYAGWFTPRHEIFPLTSWLLFSLVPNKITDYDLLLHGSAAYPQKPARSFNQSGVLVRAPHSIVSYQLIQQLGEAVEDGDQPKADYLRQQIEEQFAVASIAYDLTKVRYEPVDRWKTGQVLSPPVLVTSFTSGTLRPVPTDPSADAAEAPLLPSRP